MNFKIMWYSCIMVLIMDLCIKLKRKSFYITKRGYFPKFRNFLYDNWSFNKKIAVDAKHTSCKHNFSAAKHFQCMIIKWENL